MARCRVAEVYASIVLTNEASRRAIGAKREREGFREAVFIIIFVLLQTQRKKGWCGVTFREVARLHVGAVSSDHRATIPVSN